MDNYEKTGSSTPKYQQIAVDIASKIADGQYAVGKKLYARSSLASQYNVSSETARRALCILTDLDIVSTEKGSGATIKSYPNAVRFLHQYRDIQTISDIKRNLLESAARQREELETFMGCLSTLIEKTDRFRSINPFMPFQLPISTECPFLNQSIQQTNFWQNTGATVIALKHQGELFISPGPYAVLSESDILYFIGVEGCMERVSNFLYPVKEGASFEDAPIKN